jgi:enoyl-CoA hydratase
MPDCLRNAWVKLAASRRCNRGARQTATRFGDLIQKVALQSQVRSVIVTGSGDNFGSGTDLSERGKFTPEERRMQRRAFDQVTYAVRNMKKPIFAVVHGYSGAVSMELATSMDFIIAADNATFNLPDSMVGIANTSGGSVLPRVLSPGMAMEMMMTGDMIDAQEAHRLGMVNHGVPKAELMPLALRLARKIADNSPTAIEAQKQAMKCDHGQPTEMAIQISQMTNARAAIHADYAEGIRAFLEGREANFKDSDNERAARLVDSPQDQHQQKVNTSNSIAKAVIITGVSGDIGYATAQALIERGYRVFGSVRKKADGLRVQQALRAVKLLAVEGAPVSEELKVAVLEDT